MRANDPNEWANKRKAQMENAKKLREERKSGINDAENSTFAPQINKRPQYLNQQKDTLDNEVKIQTNDIFEQPLPGAKARQAQEQQFGGLPSPGSDALGKEMKTHNPVNTGVGRTRHPDGLTDAQYKSKFLQQNETEKQQKNRISQEAEYAPPQRQQPPPPQQQYQEQEDQFAHMLRSDASRSAGPGWNDDTTSSGFVSKKVPASVPANRHVIKKAAAPVASKQQPSYSDNYEQQRYQDEQAIRSQHQQQQQSQQQQDQIRQPRQSTNRPPPRQQQQEWSMDGDCGIPDVPPPRASVGVKVSPRGGVSGIPTPSGGVQQSKLSLLKSKIRSSESSGSSRVSSSANSSYQDYGNGSGMLKSNSSHTGSTFGSSSNVDDMPVGGGRNTAPNMYGSSAYDDGDQGQPQRSVAPKAGRRGPPLQAAAVVAPTQQSPREGYQQQSQQYQQQQQQQQQQPSRSQYSQQQEQNGGYQPNFNSNPPARKIVPPANNARGGGAFRGEVDDDDDDDQYSQPPANQQRYNQPPPSMQQQQRQQPQQQQRQPPPQQQQQQQRPPPVQQFTSEYPPEGGPPSEYPDEEEQGGGEQLECPDCGRKFNPVPYQKHIKICAKVFLTKRKAFDSTKMRVNDNPELVQILNKVKKEEKKKASKAQPQAQAAATNSRFAPDKPAEADDGGKAKWKEQSNAFREAMKAARNYSKAVATGAPLPPPVAPTIDKSLIECPNCNRRFNEKAAERHLPLCKNIINKPTQLKRGAGGGGGMNGTSTAKGGGSSKSNGKW